MGSREEMEEHLVQVRTVQRAPLPVSQQRAVDEFWRRRQQEIEMTVDFKERMLPMARLKKVIRAEEDGMMISADTPAFLTKLCELFVQELAVRAWACAESHHRRIILDSDIAEAIASTECYDFLVNVLLRYLAAQGGSTSTPPARLITRKRHRPDPDLRWPVQFGRYPPHVTPSPAPAASIHCMPFPFPFPCVLRDAEPPSAATRATPTAHGLMPPINHMTRGFILFSNNTSASYNSAAAIVAPSAGHAGALPNTPAAAYHYRPFPVTNNAEPFAVGGVDLNVIAPDLVERDIVNYDGNTDGNGDGALGISDGQQQKQKEECVLVERSINVQDTAAGGAGGIGNEVSMDMFLEEILMNEDLMFPDADLLPLVSTPPDLADFVNDQDVLDGVFSNPSSSTSSSCS